MSTDSSGARDRASATTSCFLGIYTGAGLYFIRRMTSRWQRSGTRFKSRVLIRGINGLWSVWTVNDGSPYTKPWNRSQAQTTARHSFSICAYCCSVDVVRNWTETAVVVLQQNGAETIATCICTDDCRPSRIKE